MQKNMFKFKPTPHVMTVMAMLIAMNVVFTRFLAVNLTEFMRISIGFLPNAVAGMLFGPIPAMITAALGDIIGCMLFPTGPYFFGFTLTAILGGLMYGLFLYQKKPALLNVLLCKLAVDLFLNIGLNTLWVHMLYGKAIMVLLPVRAQKNLYQYPVDVILLYTTVKLIGRIPSRYIPQMK